MVIRFYRDGVKWYADLPKYIEQGLGTVDNLEMVEGAEKGLEFLSDSTDEISLEIKLGKKESVGRHTKMANEGWSMLVLDRITGEQGEEGGLYEGSLLNDNLDKEIRKLWLCAVTKFVFNEYPEVIYVRRAGDRSTEE